MMLISPECFKRKCAHYGGVEQPDGTEMTERHACPAFPDTGIPADIVLGKDMHMAVRPDQVGRFVYTPRDQTNGDLSKARRILNDA